MFIKKSWFTNPKNGKRYITYQIAQSYKPGKGKNPRTKILATITHLGKPLIEKIELLLKSKDSIVIPSLSSFFKESYIFGSIFFLLLMMKRMGVMDCLSVIPKKAILLILGVILNRILDPRSKLGSVSWIKKTAFPYLFELEKELDVEKVYRAMDSLYRKLNVVLEEFFKQNKAKTILLLYDITSVFFEGKGPEELSKLGFSRDNQPKNPQILLSLVLNEDKMPVYYDILEGNTPDKTTVISLIENLKKRFNLSGSIFIGDRGMITIENMEFLEKEGIDYIVALTHKKAREFITKTCVQTCLFDQEVPITIFTEQDGKTQRRYVLCGSSYRKEQDLRNLEALLEKGKKALEVVVKMTEEGRLKDPIKIIRRAQKKLTQTKTESFYDFIYKDGKFEIIEKKDFIEKAKRLCGYYILQTTLKDMEDKEIETHYKELKFVEDTFRQLKDIVEIRPIFHWRNRRIRTHVFLCILAQTVIRKVMDVLKEKGWQKGSKGNSFSFFLDILSQINLGIFEIQNAKKPIITQLTSQQKELLELFNIPKEYFINFDEAKRWCRLI